MKKILLVILCLFIVTGCGAGEDIVKDLNNSVETEIAKWDDRGYATTFTLSLIKAGLKNKDYEVIASGDKEFKKAPESKEYTEEVKDYSGETYSEMRIMEEELNVNYVVVYDKAKENYYNIKITYEKKELNDVDREYPKFSDATKIK